MRKKILFCASTTSHINNFHLPYLKAFHDIGYEVHVAVNEAAAVQWADKVMKLTFYKSLISPRNIYAIFQSRRLLKTERYDKISSNTTLAGLIVRISALFLKKRPRIYHIVHGYHFNLNSGIKKYIYLIPEKIAAQVSDVVMVMNHEDYEIAQRYKLYREKLCYIDGIGVDEARFKEISPEKRIELRRQMGIALNKFVFAYAAEFSKRKNQSLLIHAFSKCNLENGILLLAGDGKQLEKCKKLAAKLGQKESIRFLGYVKNVPELYMACDAVVSVSLIEGLPFNIVEAMGCGLPVIASDIKGHRELVEQGKTGVLFESGNEAQLCKCLKLFYSAENVQLRSYRYVCIKRAKKFLLNNVFPNIMKIYNS